VSESLDTTPRPATAAMMPHMGSPLKKDGAARRRRGLSNVTL